jgi:hypothetical protein
MHAVSTVASERAGDFSNATSYVTLSTFKLDDSHSRVSMLLILSPTDHVENTTVNSIDLPH